MPKTFIHLFGASGSGTSTLGRRIAEETGFAFLDTDDFFWEDTDPPYSVKRPPAERLRRIRAELASHEAVVLSGPVPGWGDELIPLCTLAIRVEAPAPLRMERLRRRESERFGERIEEGGDMCEAHRAFLDWAAAYDTAGPEMRSRAMHDAWQQKLRCPLVLVDGSCPVEENFERVRAYLER